MTNADIIRNMSNNGLAMFIRMAYLAGKNDEGLAAFDYNPELWLQKETLDPKKFESEMPNSKMSESSSNFAFKPLRVRETNTRPDGVVEIWTEYVCPKCNKIMSRGYPTYYPHCMWCGQKLEWND